MRLDIRPRRYLSTFFGSRPTYSWSTLHSPTVGPDPYLRHPPALDATRFLLFLRFSLQHSLAAQLHFRIVIGVRPIMERHSCNLNLFHLRISLHLCLVLRLWIPNTRFIIIYPSTSIKPTKEQHSIIIALSLVITVLLWGVCMCG